MNQNPSDFFAASQDYYEYVPDGNYEVQYKSEEKSFLFGQMKLFMHFKIVSGEHADKKVFIVYNIHKSGKIGLGSKYYKHWVFMNKFIKPNRRERMSSKVFKNKILLANIRSVTKNQNKEDYSEEDKYSIIDNFVSILAG